MTVEGQTTKLNEDQRIYIFPNGHVKFAEIVELTVRPSGTHRLRTKNGHLHVIAPGWLAISIIDESTKDWTV